MAEIGSAFVSILPSARGFGSKLNSEVGGQVSSSGRKLGATFGKLFAAGAGVIAAAGIGNLLKDSIGEAREAQKVGAATEQIIKATGGAANITAGQIGTLAGAISAKSGVDDEAIQTGANLLLTFKNVRNEVGKGNDVFSQATRAAVDLSAAGFGSVDGASKMLGKALNDPIKGISALSRAGVTFTEQQKEQITTMVESGNVLGAQKTILKEVQGQVGGVAAATATAGEKASVAFGNLKEQIGTALLPIVDRLANAITTRIVPAISEFITQLQTGEGAGGRAAKAITQAKNAVEGFADQTQTGEGAGGALVAVLTKIAATARTIGPPLLATGKAIVTNKTAVLAIVGALAAYKVAIIAYAVYTKAAAAVTAVHTAAVALSTSTFGTRVGVLAIDAAAWIRSTAATVASTVAIGANSAVAAVMNLHLGTRIGLLVGSVAAWVASTAAIVASTVATTAANVAAKAYAVAQLLVNAALTANPIGLVVVAIAALVAGFVLAYKNSETFRNIVNSTFGFIAKFVPKVISAVVSFVKSHWRLLIVILGGPIGIAVALISKHFDKVKAGAQAVIGWIKNNWPAIKALVTGPFETAKTVIGKVWTALRQGASRVKDVVLSVFNAIKDAIQGVIDKTQALIDKLNSVKGAGKGVKGGSGGKGDLGRVAGRSVAEGLAGGISARGDLVVNALDGLFKKLSKKAQEKLKKFRDQLSTVRDDFASLVDPIASNFTQNLFDFDNAGAFTANLNTVKGTLATLLGNFKTLIGNGLSPGFLYQLFQSGGPALINSLAGLPKADALAAGSLFGQVTDLSNQLGTAVAGSTAKGAELEAQTVRLEKAIAKLEKSGTKNTREFAAAVNGAASNGRRNGRGGRR